jgi:Carboxypeptidase regulatory-like domain
MSSKGVLKPPFLFGLAISVAFACSVASLTANAQLAGAGLSGQVLDQSGAVVVTASLVIRNNATGEVRTATSNVKGLYSAQSLQPGIYSVTVSAPGFATHVEQGVELTVGATRELDLSLKPGQVTETVNVNAGATDVETDTSVISATVGQKRIVDLPLNGRDWTQLATLQPGVASVRPQQPTTGNSNRGVRGYGNQLASNGHSPYENTYRLDGINENDYSNGAPGNVIGANLGVDAVQEFSVVTTSYTAAYGRTSGSVINAVTRSGTNDVHGSAYVFDRDKIFDARNFFDAPNIPPFHRVQFGGAAGGPIRKNRTFVFANYEGIRQSQSQNFSSIVPSAAARSGQLHGADGTPVTVTVDPKIIPFLGLYPLPNAGLNAGTFGDTGTFNTTGLLNLTEDFVLTRFDQTFSGKDSLSLTYLYDNGPETTPDSLGNTLSRLNASRQLAGITETHIFTLSVANILRIGYNRSLGEILVPIKALTPAAGDATLGYTAGTFAPAINVVGIASTGGLGNLRQAAAHYSSYQFDDDVAVSRGAHSVTTGFAFERIYAYAQGKNQNGSATFNPSGNATGLQRFLTNHLSNGLVLPNGTTNPVEAQDSLFGGYIQDDWRIRQRLTLNLGLRYEMLTIPTDRRNRLGLVTDLNAAPGTGPCPAVISPTSVPGCVVPVSQFWQSNPTTHDFEPRIGFAYSPHGSGKTAVRGGFGIYDMLPLPYIYATYAAISAPYSQDEIAVGVPQGAFPNSVAAIAARFAPFRLGHYIEPHPKRTYSLNYNVNVERQISKTLSAMVGYVGSRTLHTPFQAQDMNQVAPSNTQVIDGRRVLPASGAIQQDANAFIIFGLLFNGAARYNSLLTQLKVRDYHGLTAQGAYTWNRCTDLGSSTQSPSTYQNSIASLIYYDNVQRKGLCDFNVTQNFSANAIYELPSPGHGWMKTLAGGWQVGGILTASTGVPFTLLQAGDALGQHGTSFGAFPDVVANCNPINGNFKSNGLNYINSNCFVFPTVAVGSAIAPLCNQGGTTPTNGQVLCLNIQGNEQRNQLIGPRLVNVDLSLIKNIRLSRISEPFNLQLRVEAFNVFNHTNFQAPTNNYTFGGRLGFNQESAGTAGLLDSTATPSRQLQLGAKIIF